MSKQNQRKKNYYYSKQNSTKQKYFRYVDIERPRRGYYTFTLKLITAEAAKEEEFFITRRSFEMLEEAIRRQPAFYLWTHNRWKRTHEEFDRQYVMVNGKTIPRENLGDSVKQ